MDWKKIVSEIMASGLTQAQIASEIGITQASVSAIARGQTTRPYYDVGVGLLRLNRKRGRYIRRLLPTATEKPLQS